MNELIFHSLAQSIVYEVNRIYHISAPEPWSKLSGSEMLVREAPLLSGEKELVESSPEESQSIFKQLHIASSIELPGTPVKDTPGRILQWFTENANLIEQPYDFQALLESLGEAFSVLPSDVPGVSLYHQIRSVMAIAAVLQYNQGQQMDSQEQFSLYSLDFSGIQSFIYIRLHC